ncbi:MAG: IS66 family insertion sequence element accessory protein TnpB [Oscillospiraceae bacterium]|nr:IS66 family insertion sequence element accessory protein TnpB [Oscillospiraceae bacterium]
MEAKTTTITTVKRELRLQEWSAQIEAQQTSGLTVQQWCSQNEIKPSTYYNRLRRVREQYLDSAPAIVPLTTPRQISDIHIEKNGLHISLPSDVEADTLIALVHELC